MLSTPKTKTCLNCNGTGIDELDAEAQCSTCKGEGIIDLALYNQLSTEEQLTNLYGAQPAFEKIRRHQRSQYA